MSFERHRKAEERRQSAILLVKTLLPMRKDLYAAHWRQFLKNALWKLTQAESVHKLDTKYQSEGAVGVPRNERRHDHVFQRAKMVDDLEEASPDEIDAILNKAVGCSVTQAEHKRLDAFKNQDGWRRYKEAGIVVIDTETGQRLDLDAMSH